MRRSVVTAFALLMPLALMACGGAKNDAARPGNKAAEIDALADNLTAAADVWRDDVDNREAAATAAGDGAALSNHLTAVEPAINQQ